MKSILRLALFTPALRNAISDGSALARLSKASDIAEWNLVVDQVADAPLTEKSSSLFWPEIEMSGPARSIAINYYLDDQLLSVVHKDIIDFNSVIFAKIHHSIDAIVLFLAPDSNTGFGSRIIVLLNSELFEMNISLKSFLSDYNNISNKLFRSFGDIRNCHRFPINSYPENDEMSHIISFIPYVCFRFDACFSYEISIEKFSKWGNDISIINNVPTDCNTPLSSKVLGARLLSFGKSEIATVIPLGHSNLLIMVGRAAFNFLSEDMLVPDKYATGYDFAKVARIGAMPYSCVLKSNSFYQGNSIRLHLFRIGESLQAIWFEAGQLVQQKILVGGFININGFKLISFNSTGNHENIRGAGIFNDEGDLVAVVAFDYTSHFDHWGRPFRERYCSIAYGISIEDYLFDLELGIDFA